MLFSFSVLAITINNKKETLTWCHSWSVEPLHCYMVSVRGYRMVARGGQGRMDSGRGRHRHSVDIDTVDV